MHERAGSWAEARRRCLRDYERCADALDRLLGALGDPASPDRHDLIAAAAVCRVAVIALLDENASVARTIAQYSVVSCGRAGELAARLDVPGATETRDACLACVESATTLILAG